METTELDKTLNDFEEKIERVRALYEQYFVGIEKLEPQIPRKDVDRILVVLRKEQIRNTAMRFKFQMLVQRYNTMQQHWQRTMREIENGTFRRDVLKAAARFGVEDAVTAVGKKQAEKMKRVLESQRARLGKQAPKRQDEFFEEVSTGDVELLDDFDDDAPTPPPVPGQAQAVRQQRSIVYQLDSPDDDGPPTYTEDPPAHPRPQRAAHDEYGAIDPGWPQQQQAHDSGPSSSAEPVKKKGGLRWGGGGARKADPEALRRMASLAGANADAFASEPTSAADAPGRARKPLLSQPIDLGLPEPEPEAPRAIPRRPLLDNPLDLDLPPSVEASTEPKREPAPRAVATSAEGQGPRRPQLRPPPPQSAEPPKSARREFGELNDGRLREIYGQYVQARRDRNESTAGITFEKLADSLRSQADKLKGKHASKRVDYEVVVKDGKTLIKPIVK